MKKSKAMMHARMSMYNSIRQFFTSRDVMEVETPILSPYGSTDVHIDSFTTQWGNDTLYLHTSPEFTMKRLLAADYGDCFQIAKVFRNEASGRNHRPEFSMLEWYRLGFSLYELIAEVGELVQQLVPATTTLPIQVVSYREAFAAIDINPHTDGLDTLQERTQQLCGYLPNLSDECDEWLDFLLVTQIEGKLGQGALTFLTHYPASMAALAKKTIDAEGHFVAERFELYYNGIELANGFYELTDAQEQHARFEADNEERNHRGKDSVAIDTDFIEALASGMPHCSGVAVGLDRVLMLAQERNHLDDVLAFPAPLIG